MTKLFPRTTVAGVSLSRMIIGTNWMLGWSHTGRAADRRITDRYRRPEDFVPMLEAFLEHGVDTLMGLFTAKPVIYEAVELTKQKTGKNIIVIDTPILNVDDSAAARREAEATVRESARLGAAFCFPHHVSAEQLVNKSRGTMDRLGDYTAMIRDAGMIPGLSAHMPELIVYADQNGYDVETYIQIYNCMGFLMQVEVEAVAAIIHGAKKPVMTIKPMAAGRCTPYVGLNFSWNTLRPCDMVAVGCFSPDEVHEDVEISLAAIERRFPNLERRGSPSGDQAALAGK